MSGWSPTLPAHPHEIHPMININEFVSDGLLTVADAAAFLNLSRTTLYGLMERGALPYVKIGRSRRVPRRALVELAGANLKGSWMLAQPPKNGGAS